jgi:CheY-like chemotaxis protein
MGEETRARVLVVEDDPEAALFLVHVLANRCRFEVIHTADPATALQLAAGEHWDLVLTDLDMPGMTGLELLGALRQVAPALPVAVVSATSWTGCRPDCWVTRTITSRSRCGWISSSRRRPR